MLTDSTMRSRPRSEAAGSARRRITAAATVPLLIVLASCGEEEPVAAPGESAPAIVKFASIDDLTGQSAAFGTSAMNGRELAVEQVNADGGFTDDCGQDYRVELTQEDFQGDKDQAISLIRRAAADSDVLAVLGPTPSTGFVPAVPIAGAEEIVVMASGSGALIEDWNGWAYRANPTLTETEPVMFRKLHEEFGFDEVAIVYDQTQDGQTTGARAVRDEAAALGVDVVLYDAIDEGQQDFSVVISKIAAEDVGWLGLYAPPPELGRMLRQLQEAGVEYEGAFTTTNSFAQPETIDLSAGASVGGYSNTGFDVNGDSPGAKEFVGEYQAMFDEPPSEFSVYGYDTVMLSVEAITRACSGVDREKFRDALNDPDGFDRLSGKITFDNPPTGNNLTPTVLVTRTTGPGTYDIVFE